MPAPENAIPARERALTALLLLAVMLAAQWSHDRVVGSDGFFHVAQARRVLTGGMPWMPLSIFGDGWVDHQLGFHLLLAPLAAVLPGVAAAKVGAAVLGSFALWGLWLVMARASVPMPLLFALLPVAVSWQALVRLEMPRAQGLALGLMALGVGAMMRDRPRIVFALCLVFTWSYQVALLMVPIALVAALLGFRRAPAAAAAGTLLGFAVHPHSPGTLRFLWQHVVLKVRNSADLPVGTEWTASGLGELWSMSAGGLCVLAAAFALLLRERRRPQADTLLVIAVAVCATLGAVRSAKFLEYATPWSCVALGFALREARRLPGARTRSISAIVLAIGLLWSGDRARGAVQRTEPPPDRLQAASAWLDAHAAAGARVFHFSWNDWPELVFWGPSREYIVGLDPHFLHLADPDLWTLYDRIGQGWGANPSKPIRDRFGARWAILVLPYPGARELLESDPGLALAWQDAHAIVYEVLPVP